MIILNRGIRINYIQYGEGQDIVLLHGWGQNIEMMRPLGDPLSQNYRVTILDLPGFGSSEEPKEIWTIFDYELMLEDVLKQLNIVDPILIGHSFGGRISIIYASKCKTKKVVLLGSPCIRKERELSKKEKMLKKMKKVKGLNKIGEFAKKYMGSEDYRNASPMMRNILVNVINQDLSDCAKKITAPTLLVWGSLDTAAPLEEAEELEKIIPDAGLVVFENCTHYAYLENRVQLLRILDNFL